ncbi:sensor histidine kinase [Streptomyces sp. NPDC090442]|uniref:sensor histidine kinase n=1 Tax=Streptomyces sp. NPDC090442 TaxID=3365962 RepID=UPI0038127843
MSAEASRSVAWVRLLMLVPLAMAGRYVGAYPTGPWFGVLVAAYALWSVARLLWVYRRPVAGMRSAAAAVAVDLALITAMAAVSGGQNSAVRYAYFMWPMATVLWQLPKVTAAFGAVCMVGYAVVSLPDLLSHGSSHVWPVLVDLAYLLWTVLASVVIAVLLRRRTRRVTELLRAREVLLEDALQAEQRERGDLADALHDGPVQTLLVALQDLYELQEQEPGQAQAGGDLLTRACAEVHSTVRELRGVIFDLHPQVLSAEGLGPALRSVAHRAAQRGSFTVHCDIRTSGRSAHEALLYSVARELLGNAAKHARASDVWVELRTEDGETVLTVRDNGVGFDPDVVRRRLREGHIGLTSRRVRVESAGGHWVVTSVPGGPTTAEVRLPE